MSGAGLEEAAREEILRRDILPLYFPDSPTAQDEASSFVLVAGQPGAGRGRAVSALRGEGAGEVAVVTGDGLRAFHPDAARPIGVDPEGDAVISQTVATWVSACIRYAREHHRSLALEGTFANAAAAAGTAERFAAAGFATRVVVVESRRAESLLSVTSSHLRDVQAGRPTRFISRDVHDAGLEATRVLVASLEETAWADRVTVLGRNGRTVFDRNRTDAVSGFVGAGAALRDTQSTRMGRFDATQWLSELHHTTQFAATARDLPDAVVELLVDLHETSLREVIPQLHVPAMGKFATAMEHKTVAALVALRQSLPTAAAAPRVDVTAPVISPAGPERGGLSR
ncbi:zeta toxin family protein [Microbacterium trichothecenolyticum]|uniref:UDP-N-acetylglucosamine kinase n=1 Tax=Microbacterium trichothecenolyticum TaxID=69370 RepID=A0A0M2HGF9_MICTR|nr:zeta toxin family protein [Microbacterium trichothecenolyticum]KJL45769.1 Zeta toxin [Microbacterium trichothecenolyticum]